MIEGVQVNAIVEKSADVDDLIWWVNCFEQVSALGSWDAKTEWGEVFFFAGDDYEKAGRVSAYVLAWEGERCPYWPGDAA